MSREEVRAHFERVPNPLTFRGSFTCRSAFGKYGHTESDPFDEWFARTVGALIALEDAVIALLAKIRSFVRKSTKEPSALPQTSAGHS